MAHGKIPAGRCSFSLGVRRTFLSGGKKEGIHAAGSGVRTRLFVPSPREPLPQRYGCSRTCFIALSLPHFFFYFLVR